MICCSVEQHDNGISHVCNWRSCISARYVRGFTGFSVAVWQSSPLPPSGQRGWLHLLNGALLEDGNGVFACVSVGVSLPRTCPSGPCASCNLPDTREAPSDSLLLGPLDSPGWGWIFISLSERVRMHVCLHACVWWVCNLSDTSQPRGRDTRGMTDNNSAFTGQIEQPRVTGWQRGLHLFLHLLIGKLQHWW